LAKRYTTLSSEAGVDEAEAERRVFAELVKQPGDWSRAYEDFIRLVEPERRRAYGVYYTPPSVVRAQVRLVDDLLRHELGCADGFADPRVSVVDPATGSGAYPLAVLEHIGHAADVRGRMVLFEASPGGAAVARAQGLPIQECDALETSLEVDAPIVVCLGNPPYRRRAGDSSSRARLDGFLTNVDGVHLKNLYNDYVYFWRWALRVAIEQRSGPAIVCLVTAGSYVRGPAFDGFRRTLRGAFEQLWLIDLEGDQLAARASENVFPIRTPVAICLGFRRSTSHARARVHYARLDGSRAAKLDALDAIGSVNGITWQAAPDGSGDAFAPRPRSEYASWPSLCELFPWQVSGAQLKRTWPIASTPEVLRARWQQLLRLPPDERAYAFGPTRDRTLSSAPPDLHEPNRRLRPLRDLGPDTPCIEPMRYAYRSFDRQWVLPDARLGDFMRPRLWRSDGSRQIFLTSPLTNVLGSGPAVVAAGHVPDLDHFRGSFGARAVIPLWHDAAATRPNVAPDWLARLSARFNPSPGFAVSAEALMAYCYALLSTRGYVRRFENDLRVPGPRVPLTTDGALFLRAVEAGRELLALHSYRRVPRGLARCVAAVGDEYPTSFTYDPVRECLTVGSGRFEPVTRNAWNYVVSGYRVLNAWLAKRVRRHGRSPLDGIVPERWTLTDELLELVWLLEATCDAEPALDTLLDEVVSSSRGGW
jgi:hypothetical protein